MPDTIATPAVPAVAIPPAPFKISDAFLIPVEEGQAVNKGWPARHGGRPLGVTWHWAVTRKLSVLTQVLGGAHAERKGKASAHYGVGRSFAEGVHRYVSLENRSWHAGINQTLRWNGAALADDADFKGSRSTIGIETSHIGANVDGIVAGPDWIRTATPLGKPILVQPWTDEQIAMCIEVGREIVRRWPHIRPQDHHGHHDICPVDPQGRAYKIDVCGFPFAKVLRGIYDNASIPDVWTPLETVRQRQRALIALGFDLGRTGADGSWGPRSTAALRLFQRHQGLVPNGLWSTFVSRAVHDELAENGRVLAQVTAGPL
ncbi:MAG TPA: N-acetylmuramoyl-L-alanine amidase [Longimicrobium sp.]|nr:N-acetylmuramoyl-L-alanine amidase [Longimicrobium sp.]